MGEILEKGHISNTTISMEVICELAKGKMRDDLCLKWYVLHIKKDNTAEEIEEMDRLFTEIQDLQKRLYC
jgi:hypothetical protein